MELVENITKIIGNAGPALGAILLVLGAVFSFLVWVMREFIKTAQDFPREMQASSDQCYKLIETQEQRHRDQMEIWRVEYTVLLKEFVTTITNHTNTQVEGTKTLNRLIGSVDSLKDELIRRGSNGV